MLKIFIKGAKKMRPETVSDEFRPLLKQIGANLAKARKEKGLSQRTIVRSSGHCASMVGKVESYPSLDISLRSIYEVSKLIPVSLGRIIGQAERDLALHPGPNERLENLMDKMIQLNEEEKNWMADMIEGLLAKTYMGHKKIN